MKFASSPTLSCRNSPGKDLSGPTLPSAQEKVGPHTCVSQPTEPPASSWTSRPVSSARRGPPQRAHTGPPVPLDTDGCILLVPASAAWSFPGPQMLASTLLPLPGFLDLLEWPWPTLCSEAVRPLASITVPATLWRQGSAECPCPTHLQEVTDACVQSHGQASLNQAASQGKRSHKPCNLGSRGTCRLH